MQRELSIGVALAITQIVNASATQPLGQNVPVIVVEIGSVEITRTERAPVWITVVDGQTAIRSKAEMSIRGSSSSTFPKKPYRLELQDENGDDLKVSLLGLPKESDWILFPAYSDKTMTRDVLAYELWRRMGYWAPRTRYVELYIHRQTSPGDSTEERQGRKGSEGGGTLEGKRGEDPPPSYVGGHNYSGGDDFGTNGYEGVYVLVEKIKRGKERVNIAKLGRGDNREPKITGGYIFKKDRTNTNDRAFRSSKGILLVYDEPKARDITPEQEAYLTNYVNNFEQALFSVDFRDPDRGYRKYIDIDSFVDYHWMVEVSKNVDGYWFSVFFHKDRNDKLRAGPVWDYDLSFGNQLFEKGNRTDGWVWEHMRRQYTWFRRLFDDPDFVQRYIDRWPELRSTVFATSNILALVDRFAREIGPAAYDRNYKRWPTLGEPVAGNAFAGKNWQEDIVYLKEWIKGRLDWIDSQDFPKPAMVVDNGSESSGSQVSGSKEAPGSKDQAVVGRVGSYNSPLREEVGKGTFNVQRSIRMACLVGKIYYTTDGTDPRLSGGAVSPKALEYKEPVPVTPGLRLFARVRSDYGLWSAPVTFGE